MSLTGAEQAVFDHLAAAPGPVTWVSPPSPGGWAASTATGGGAGADPATVRFRKSRAFPGCQLHEVEFAHPRRPARSTARPHLAGTRRHPGWPLPSAAAPAGGPYRSKPWVNFAAQWNAQLFAAGGPVTGQGAEAAHLVRLTFAGGTASRT